MQVLVVGGTGVFGSEVARELLRRGAAVRVLTRSAEKIAGLPEGVEGAVGDLDSPSSLPPAFKAVDAVFAATASSPDESAQGLSAVEAAQAAGVSTFVYLSVYRANERPEIPHFASKVPVEIAVSKSGLAWTILRPNDLFQNELKCRDGILEHSIYPLPFGNQGVSRVDVRDVAEVAANALFGQPGYTGAVLPVVGPDAWSDGACAAVLGAELGMDLRTLNVPEWRELVSKAMPAWLLEDLTLMYNDFRGRGLPASPQEKQFMPRLLGHPSRSYDSYARELAMMWKGRKAAV